MNDCRKCKYFVPAWAGNKTSGSQPAYCLKKVKGLTNNPEYWKDCAEGEEVKE